MAWNFKGAFRRIRGVGKTALGILGLGTEGGKIEIVLPSVTTVPTTPPPGAVYAGVDVSQYYPVIGIIGAGLLVYFLLRK